MVDTFVNENGALDTANSTGVMFFYALGIAAGFSDELVINVLGRVVGMVHPPDTEPDS